MDEEEVINKNQVQGNIFPLPDLIHTVSSRGPKSKNSEAEDTTLRMTDRKKDIQNRTEN